MRRQAGWSTFVLATIVCVVQPSVAVAQGPVCDIPLLDRSAPEELLETMRAQYKADIEALAFESRALREAVADDWRSIHDNLLGHLEEEGFIFGTPLNSMLDSVLNAILIANPEIKRPRLLLSANPWPNASCRGEGTIVVDLGLLDRLRSRSELAFVLAHELAHAHLSHVGESIERLNRKLHSKEFRSEVRSVLRQEYDRLAKLEELFVDFSVNSRRHGRNREQQADSLALRFIQRTAFDPAAALSTMDVLDRCDAECDTSSIIVQEALAKPGVAFTEAWMEGEVVSSLAGVDTRDQALADSLKTHPDCMKRKASIAVLLGPEVTDTHAPQPDYLALAELTSEMLAMRALAVEDAGRALFLALQRLRRKPDDAHMMAIASSAFAIMRVNGERHTLGEVLLFPSPDMPRNYRDLLRILHELRLSDLRALAVHYHESARALAPDCAAVTYAGFLLAFDDSAPGAIASVRESHGKTIPDGFYRQLALEFEREEP